jgi:3-oxoacyl-[acyl-carrier protein] reductase
MMQLDGLNALVTGGSGDIGSAIANTLAEAGANVAVSYLGRPEEADETAQGIVRLGRRGVTVQLDQRVPDSIESCVRSTVEQLGGVDILVNNAGWNIGIPFSDLEALTSDIFDRLLETNLRGPYLVTRALAGELRRHGRGRVVNIGSVAGILPTGSSIAYSASKAALIHLTRCLAVALAPDVNVNCVAPGLIEGTRMAHQAPEELLESIRADTVLGRVGSAADIAQQVVTFCRQDAVTGQTITADGGMPGAMR